jgi:hypothetical protein
MARLSVVGLSLAASLALAACSAARLGDDSPSASIPAEVGDLAGHWRGTLWETGADRYQGSSAIDVRVADDGTWTGKIGTAPASGTARRRGSHLVVTGTMQPPDAAAEPVYVELKGDGQRYWGAMAALFRGRRAPAAVSLERVEAN